MTQSGEEILCDDVIRAVCLKIGWGDAVRCDYRLARPWYRFPKCDKHSILDMNTQMKGFNNMRKRKIYVLATGGTIAGAADSAAATTGYRAGQLGIGQLLQDLPAADDSIELVGEEIAAIDSKDITEEVLLKLARRTQEVLSESETAGVVITHGTDTLEETAYFLHLTLHTAKPVVLTGAMRPATALSADGPLNLLQAIRVASCASSVGRGVLVVANGEIHSARDVRKVHTTAVHTFQSPGLGPLGVIDDASIEYYRQTTRRHTLDSELQLPEQQRGGRYLPDVRILYGQAGDDGLFAAAACSAGVRGIVYAGFGNGSLPALVETALAAAVEQGVIVVRSTRSPEGAVLAAEPSYDEHGFIASGTLSPQQARILLQLGLLHSSDRSYILRLFREY